MQMLSVTERLSRSQQRLEQTLTRVLQAAIPATQPLWDAMRYSSLNGGKRLRPALVFATAECFAVSDAALDDIACAIELIHVYSLIHDDLPAMDNDDLRRGLPTCHRQFDEATAILAGDALQALAFDCLAHAHMPAELCVRLLQDLAKAAGANGMAGGQAIDLAAAGRALTESELQRMHGLKTGALITASIVMAAKLCQASEAQLQALTQFGHQLGLCFQMVDDLLDVTGNTHTLGKRVGADQALNKPTYVSVLGLTQTQQRAQASFAAAMDSLQQAALLHTAPLSDLARFVIERQT